MVQPFQAKITQSFVRKYSYFQQFGTLFCLCLLLTKALPSHPLPNMQAEVAPTLTWQKLGPLSSMFLMLFSTEVLVLLVVACRCEVPLLCMWSFFPNSESLLGPCGISIFPHWSLRSSWASGTPCTGYGRTGAPFWIHH